MLRAVLDSLESTSDDDPPQPMELEAIVVSDARMPPGWEAPIHPNPRQLSKLRLSNYEF